MLPVDHIAATSGVAIIFYPWSKRLRRFGRGYLLIMVGIALLLSVLLYPKALSITQLYGANMVDADYSPFGGAVFWLSLLAVS